jgi:cyd operon protein YbgT
MWYFTWILGVGFACAFSILNAMWLELHELRPVEVTDDVRSHR